MAVARENEVQERLGKIEKELATLRRSKSAAGTLQTAGTLPIILALIVVAGAGSLYTLSEMISDSNAHFRMRIDHVNTRIDDTNDRIRDLKSDLEKDIDKLESRIDDIDAKLDRLLLR